MIEEFKKQKCRLCGRKLVRLEWNKACDVLVCQGDGCRLRDVVQHRVLPKIPQVNKEKVEQAFAELAYEPLDEIAKKVRRII